jgi:prophage regulatory protein
MASMRILRLPNVFDRTGLSRSTVYQQVSEGRFPKPVSLGARAVGWVESDIEDQPTNREQPQYSVQRRCILLSESSRAVLALLLIKGLDIFASILPHLVVS